jgi:O-antigen ligase
MALHFTGGRAISVNSGSDRTALWGEGLQLLKAHPLFGVGLGRMGDFTDSHLTAHNSVVVCAVELGLVGLYFWSLFLLSTVRSALAVASPAKISEAEPVISEEGLLPQATGKMEVIDRGEVKGLGSLVVLSLTGFFVTGWFLSRPYVPTFFLLGGIAEVVFEMALQKGMVAPRMRLARLLPYTGGLAISLVLLMYVMLRVTNLLH